MKTLVLPLCAALLLIGMGVGTATTASAYCPRVADKKTIRWNKPPAIFRVSSSLTDKAILAAIDKAFSTWAGASCSALSFKKGSTFKVCTTTKCKEFANPDHAIYIHWVTGTSTLFTNPTPKGQPYFANYSFSYDKTGGFGGAALAINAKDYKWDAKGGSATKAIFDVWNEMVPLIGWAIGLHDSLTKGSVMNGSSVFGDTSRRKLAQDDINGVRYLYGLCSCKAPSQPDAKCKTKSPGRPVCFKTGGGDGGPVPADAGPGKKDTGGSGSKDSGGSGLDAASPLDDSGITADWYTPGGDSPGGQVKCTASSQCQPDERCTVEGTCVKIGGQEDDGCSCAMADPSSAGRSLPGPLLLILIGLAGIVISRAGRGTLGDI